MDPVCVAQAFHWFDAEQAFAELAWVLRPGGGVGMVWNARDLSMEWVDRVWAIMDEAAPGKGRRKCASRWDRRLLGGQS